MTQTIIKTKTYLIEVTDRYTWKTYETHIAADSKGEAIAKAERKFMERLDCDADQLSIDVIYCN